MADEKTNIIVEPKLNFKVAKKVEAFYTGGKVQDDDDITCFILSQDNEILITASKSGLLRQWNWKEQTVTRKWKTLHNSPIICMAFDSTSTLLATGSTDNTIKVWDIVKQYCTHNLRGSRGIINLVEFHPDSSKLQLFSVAADCKIRIWDLTSSKCISLLEGHFSQVTGLVFLDDHQHMITTGRDKVVIFWDLSTRRSLKTIPVYEGMESVMLLPTSSLYEWCSKQDETERLFATTGEEGIVKVWSFPSGKLVYTQQLPSLSVESEDDKSRESLIGSPACVQAMINQSLNCLATVTYDHSIILYDLVTMKKLKQFVGHYDEILDMKFAGEDHSLLAVATNSSQVKVIERETTDCQILHGHTETVLSLDVSYDGRYVASCSKDNTVRVWKLQDKTTFSCVAIGAGHTHAVGAVSWPKKSTDYVVTGSQDLTIKSWKLPSIFKQNVIVKLTAHWTVKAHDKDINSVTYSPNDKLIATGSQDKTAKIFRAIDGSLHGALRGHRRGIWCVMFSPVDKCLATASADSTIKLWSIQDLTCIKTLEGHTNSVLKLQFMTRGTQIVSSGSDGLVKIWNVSTNECSNTLDEHVDKVWSLSLNKNEDTLVTGGGDSILNIWKDVTEEERRVEEEKQDELILKQQELSNLLEQKNYVKAVALAITLNQPFRVLTIFKNLLEEESGRVKIEKIVDKLRDDQIDAVLKLMCDWNTNARHSNVSQTVLSIVMEKRSAADLMSFSNMKESIEAMLPYTERHFNRISRLLQQSAFLDYTWQAMKLAAVEEDRDKLAVTERSTSEGDARRDPQLVEESTDNAEERSLVSSSSLARIDEKPHGNGSEEEECKTISDKENEFTFEKHANEPAKKLRKRTRRSKSRGGNKIKKKLKE
eukprot:gene12111-13362_t